MSQDSIVIYLVVATAALLVSLGIYQWFKTRRGHRDDAHPALGDSAAAQADLRGTMTRWHR